MPGATKDWKNWRKTWQDLKSRTKTKAGTIRNHARGTGGGSPLEDKLSSIEEDILDCVKRVSVEGHKEATESAVEFDFSFTEEPSTVPISEFQFIEEEITVPKDNVYLDAGVTATQPKPSTSGNMRVPQRKTAIKSTLQAVNDFKTSMEKRTLSKEQYYERKLAILERLATAKEEGNVIKGRIASAIESIADSIS